MVPPTGAADSILVVRRNGASVDAYYGAPSSQLKSYAMESNTENKVKKQWGERWRTGKAARFSGERHAAESPSFVVHPDYLNKYGTLSNGVVTKSMKYAETWLYGTVGVRGTPPHRPSLFLYPGVAKPGPRMIVQNGQAGFAPSAGTFLPVPISKYPCIDRNSTIASHKLEARPLLKTPEQCQCSDYRRETKRGNGSPCKKCGGKKSLNCTVRGGRSHKGTLLEITTPHDKANLPAKAHDPYNMMRRNRLSVSEAAETSIFRSDTAHKRVKSKSLSPMRDHGRQLPSPSFETFKPKQSEDELKDWKTEEEWANEEEEEEEDEGGDEEKMKRKSILECEVNPYELNGKSSDDSSDELGDETLRVNAKMNILRPKLTKTDVKKKTSKIPGPEMLSHSNEGSLKTEVRLSGQRFKIFDHSNLSTDPVQGYASDEHEKQDLYIPRLASPKRPPRRLKDKSPDATPFKYSKSKSKSSPNLSIKSILKKPAGNEESSELPPSTHNSPETEESSSSSSSTSEKPREILLRPVQLPGKSAQNTFKKKKQVQFKVNVSNESLTEKIPDATTSDEIKTMDATRKTNREVVQRSVSCEDLLLVNETFHASPNEKETKKSEEPPPEEATVDDAAQDDEETSVSTLRRTYSDRRPAGAVALVKNGLSTANGSNALFHDTMALRMRTARTDSRDVFTDEDGQLQLEEDGKGKRRSRPKEPPPQPPLPMESPISTTTAVPSVKSEDSKLTGNIITYAEFARLTDGIGNDRSYLRRLRCKSLDNTVSMGREGKSPPSPPPRQTYAKSRKLSSPGAMPVKLRVPPDEKSDRALLAGCPKEKEKVSEDRGKPPANLEPLDKNRTIVTLGTDTLSSGAGSERHSIAINPTNAPDDYLHFGKTSVVINNFRKEDSNKVTISVRNEALHEEEPNSSSCTIIETGSNSTVIPVMSTDNKTTLIVGNSSVVPVNESEKAGKPSQYVFSNISGVGEEAPKTVVSMDPVEAIRRNLIPHICGKEETNPTLMEKIRQSRESRDRKKQICQLFAEPSQVHESAAQLPPESLLTTYHAKRNLTSWNNATNGPFKIEDDNVSLTDSFTSSVKNSSTNTSRSNSFRSNSTKNPESDYDANAFLPISVARSKYYALSDAEEAVTQERDKLEDEYEIRSGLSENKKDESENIYETIKEEPIYDQIGIKPGMEESDDDTPPPLPLTLPPSLDEVEKRSPKSIFEGASKYDILSYLVDAKDRVQEDTYFSGSSTSEEVDSQRLSLAEEVERISFDGGMHCRLPSDGLETGENLRPCKKDTSLESDSSVDLSSRISQISQTSDSSDDNLILTVLTERESLKLNRKSSAEIERNDSGVGSETSQTSRSKWQASSSIREDPHHLCEDCDQIVETQVTDSGVMYAPLVCRKCSKRRSERKEIIQEIVETEEKYGRDLKIILEEFYRPMLVAGLLTPDQLSAIFLNTEELLENNEQLTEKMRDTLEIAAEQGDEDFLTVNIGKLFLEAGQMLHAFESYCTRQATAAVLLANLEKEKELLRIFLRVSQMENTVLRRMNLNSFLMVPVQRVTKYPLLLARLYKVTPPQHESRDLLKEAQHNIELHLEHMNSEAKDLSAIKVWRRFSASTASGRKSTAELEMINIKLRKMAIDVLEWNHEEVRFVMEGKLLYTQPTDNNWKRGRTIKLSPIFVLLVTLGKPNSKYKSEPSEDELTFPRKTGVREATLLLVKEKCGRYTLIREPLFLDKIIVCCETDADEYFEIQELSTKDTIIFKAEDGERTKEWYRQLQYHAQILGSWRRRRNALANIMINGMMARTYTT